MSSITSVIEAIGRGTSISSSIDTLLNFDGNQLDKLNSSAQFTAALAGFRASANPGAAISAGFFALDVQIAKLIRDARIGAPSRVHLQNWVGVIGNVALIGGAMATVVNAKVVGNAFAALGAATDLGSIYLGHPEQLDAEVGHVADAIAAAGSSTFNAIGNFLNTVRSTFQGFVNNTYDSNTNYANLSNQIRNSAVISLPDILESVGISRVAGLNADKNNYPTIEWNDNSGKSYNYISNVGGIFANLDLSGAIIELDSNSAANVQGTSNIFTTLPGSVLGAYRGGNTINAAPSSLVAIGNTGTAFSTVNVNGNAFGGKTVTGQDTGIWVGSNSAVNLFGSYNGAVLAGGAVLGGYGGGNTFNVMGPSLLAIGSTGNVFDQVNSNGNAFGGRTVTGQDTGINIGSNSAVNLGGGGNGIVLAGGSVLGAYGGGNTINVVGRALAVVGSTGGTFTTVNANHNAFGGQTITGQDTGLYLAPNSAVNLFGSYNGASVTAGSVLGAYGSGNIINASVGSLVAVGSTGGIATTVNANGLTFGGSVITGQGTGIYVGNGAKVNIAGIGNDVSAGPGSDLNIDLARNNLNLYNADNSYDLYRYDKAGNASWSRYVEHYDGQNRNTSRITFQDDASRDVTYIDAYNQKNWGTDTHHYDGNGAELSTLTIYDDGSRDYSTLDPYNQNPWSVTVEHFDPTGNKTSRTIVSDDGTRKTEYWTRGTRSEPNNPDRTEYYNNSGGLIRTNRLEYSYIAETNQSFLIKSVTTDVANTGSWNEIGMFFNNKRQVVIVYTVNDMGQGGPVIDAGYFNSSWNYASSVDDNSYLMRFNQFSYFSSARSQDLNLPALSSYDPLYNYALPSYTVYKGNNFFGSAYSDPFRNIQIRDPNGYHYYDFEKSSFGYAPVVLDLDGNGIDLASLGHSNAQFDARGDGTKASTSWTAGSDGLLVIDLSADGSPSPDGKIDQRKEISFVDWLSSTSRKGVSDLQALEQVFDTDGNGKLDAKDKEFSAFRVWQDKNGDGVVQNGEMKDLKEWGIESINLVRSGSDVFLPDGTAIHGFSSFTQSDGSTHDVADVSFAVARDAGLPATVVSGYNVKLSTQGTYDVTNLYAPGALSADDIGLLTSINGGAIQGVPVLGASGRNVEQVAFSTPRLINSL